MATTDIYTHFARLQPYLEAYDMSNERILDMYCEKRYEDLSILYALFAFLAWPALLLLGACCGSVILRLAGHRKMVH